jgi:hypothetical protein
MTPRKRVMAVLNHEKPDKIPLTIYEGFTQFLTCEKELRDRGLCVVYRMSSWKESCRGLDIRTDYYKDEHARNMVRTTYSTPVGEVYTVKEPGLNTMWTKEYMFKSPDDYKVLRYIAENRHVEPAYEEAEQKVMALGEDYIIRDRLPLEPLQSLISSDIMDPITFSLEWYDNRDELLKLYEANVAFNRQIYQIVADGPLETLNYGGNVVPQIIGPENFKKYYLPNYQEAAEIMHRKGKLIGTHLDADNSPIMTLIPQTCLDYIEAYDPSISPRLSTASGIFGDKVIWINWPSGMHYKKQEEIERITYDMIHEVKGENLIIGVTEDMPEGRYDEILTGVMNGIDSYETETSRE